MFDYFYFGLGLSFGVYAILAAYTIGKNKGGAIREQQADDLKACKAEIVKLKIDLERAYEALDAESKK